MNIHIISPKCRNHTTHVRTLMFGSFKIFDRIFIAYVPKITATSSSSLETSQFCLCGTSKCYLSLTMKVTQMMIILKDENCKYLNVEEWNYKELKLGDEKYILRVADFNFMTWGAICYFGMPNKQNCHVSSDKDDIAIFLT